MTTTKTIEWQGKPLKVTITLPDTEPDWEALTLELARIILARWEREAAEKAEGERQSA